MTDGVCDRTFDAPWLCKGTVMLRITEGATIDDKLGGKMDTGELEGRVGKMEVR
jgi:hypothetical protein